MPKHSVIGTRIERMRRKKNCSKGGKIKARKRNLIDSELSGANVKIREETKKTRKDLAKIKEHPNIINYIVPKYREDKSAFVRKRVLAELSGCRSLDPTFQPQMSNGKKVMGLI